MIKPTIGRIVWYHPTKQDGTKEHPYSLTIFDTTQPLAAQVAYVHAGARMVNLSVSDQIGFVQGRTSVTLLQEGEERPESGGYCTWMPYQVGQAAKQVGPMVAGCATLNHEALQTLIQAQANAGMVYESLGEATVRLDGLGVEQLAPIAMAHLPGGAQ